jgi:hypothetical protein
MTFQNESREIVDHHIVRCVYANGSAINVVTQKGYKDPSVEKMCSILLEKEIKFVEESLKPIRDLWAETGASIVSDRWKNEEIDH